MIELAPTAFAQDIKREVTRVTFEVYRFQNQFHMKSNKRAFGGARLSGNRVASAEGAFSFRWLSIFSMTAQSSMQTITLTVPPHSLPVSMPRVNTTFLLSVFPFPPLRSVCPISAGLLPFSDFPRMTSTGVGSPRSSAP